MRASSGAKEWVTADQVVRGGGSSRSATYPADDVHQARITKCVEGLEIERGEKKEGSVSIKRAPVAERAAGFITKFYLKQSFPFPSTSIE